MSRILKNFENQQIRNTLNITPHSDGVSNYNRYYRSRFFSSRGTRFSVDRGSYRKPKGRYVQDMAFHDPAIVTMVRNQDQYHQNTSSQYYGDRRNADEIRGIRNRNSNTIMANLRGVETQRQSEIMPKSTDLPSRRRIAVGSTDKNTSTHSNNSNRQFNVRNNGRKSFYNRHEPFQNHRRNSLGLPNLQSLFQSSFFQPNYRNTPYGYSRYKQFIVIYDRDCGFYYLPVKGDLRNLTHYDISNYQVPNSRRYSNDYRRNDYSYYRRRRSNDFQRNGYRSYTRTRYNTKPDNSTKNDRKVIKSNKVRKGSCNDKTPVELERNQKQDNSKSPQSASAQKNRRRYNRKLSIQTVVKKVLGQITGEVDDNVKVTIVEPASKE